ncbi:hypothetical protein DAPPUDRAFT_325821 [Daphnia pulex]|uniref:Uncharacterized protein n=1 Tax=Daphnia pulex TaxID=6669 RepID=E9H5V9_DAPPU|nr:hypothetical protein DAPPUDRAFT_325821 [Daphnia pulex]|eukprot:EFX72873.1 hypothetical protein DAPPUDRAFT_325821 [Daphnia pulex]
MADKDLRLRVPLEELDVLLETENEEIFDELQQDPDIKASPKENIESMTSESENDFSNDSSET